MSSGFQYTGSVCSARKPLGAGNTSVSQVDEESVVPVNSSAYTVTTPNIAAPSSAWPPFGHHNPQSTLGSQNQTRGYDGITNMWDNYQPNPQYRNYPQVPTDPSNNISLTLIEVVSDILEANQCEQDINLIDGDTKSLSLDEKLGVLALTYNVNSATDLHNQRDNYLNDLDWDRPPPIKLCIQREYLSGHAHSYMVNLADHFLH